MVDLGSGEVFQFDFAHVPDKDNPETALWLSDIVSLNEARAKLGMAPQQVEMSFSTGISKWRPSSSLPRSRRLACPFRPVFRSRLRSLSKWRGVCRRSRSLTIGRWVSTRAGTTSPQTAADHASLDRSRYETLVASSASATPIAPLNDPAPPVCALHLLIRRAPSREEDAPRSCCEDCNPRSYCHHRRRCMRGGSRSGFLPRRL